MSSSFASSALGVPLGSTLRDAKQATSSSPACREGFVTMNGAVVGWGPSVLFISGSRPACQTTPVPSETETFASGRRVQR